MCNYIPLFLVAYSCELQLISHSWFWGVHGCLNYFCHGIVSSMSSKSSFMLKYFQVKESIHLLIISILHTLLSKCFHIMKLLEFLLQNFVLKISVNC
jgi:hypothetical protein